MHSSRIQYQSLSGNTYIQFSFEKSLRKYQKLPYKKVHLNNFNNINNINNNSNKNRSGYVLISQKKNEFSHNNHNFYGNCNNQNQKIYDRQKDIKSNEKNVSQFSHNDQKDNHNNNQLQNYHINQNYHEYNEFNDVRKRLIFTNEQMINQMQQNQIINNNNNDNSNNNDGYKIIQQSLKDSEFDHIQLNIDLVHHNKRQTKQTQSLIILSQAQSQTSEPQPKISVQQLISAIDQQSKQQVQLQYKQLQQDIKNRIIYKIKKVKQLQDVCNQCEQLSIKLSQQLSEEVNKKDDEKINYQGEKINEDVTEYENFCGQEEQDELNELNQQDDQDEKDEQNDSVCQRQQKEQHLQQHDSLKRNHPSFQQSYCSQQSNQSYHTKKQRQRRINFQISQNYTKLGRIKLSSYQNSQLQQPSQTIYLSIRSVNKHKYFVKNQQNQQKYDYQRVIKDLIKQRPYLEKYKREICEVIRNVVVG